MLVEIIGYVASIVVAISLTMSSILKLRIINLIGAITFVIYGLMLPTYPVAFVNFLIACINVYYLIQMSSQKEYFQILDSEANSQYLTHFLDFHRQDILKFFPQFNSETQKAHRSFFVLRNTVPAGLIVFEEKEDHVNIVLDYVTPQFRDFKVGQFLYKQNCQIFTGKKVCCKATSPWLERYLPKMGFVKQGESFILEAK